mgnify:CR=1 FL=1
MDTDKYCQNPWCANEATKAVPVSVNRPNDQTRRLRAACEEVFSWRVQHWRLPVQEHRH